MSKIQSRKGLLALFTTTLLVFLIGCSSESTESTNGKDKKETINIVAHSNYEEPLQKVIEQFEEQNDSVEVDLEVVPFDELMESIEVRLSAESTDVDLLFVDAPLVANYTLKQYLTPLD